MGGNVWVISGEDFFPARTSKRASNRAQIG
jgi:hypothetical protein